jgi:DNA-binding transcriptional ArsR family regulator
LEDQYFFESIEQIQATAEPTRWKILELLITRSMTGSQLARVLGIQRPLAHYHLKILEKVGLVKFQEQQIHGSMVERYYRAIAREFRSDHLVDSYRIGDNANGNRDRAGEVVQNMMEAMLTVAHADLVQLDVRPILAKTGFNFQDDVYLTQAQTNAFILELRNLAERYQKLEIENRENAEHGDRQDINHIRFTWLLTPVAPLPSEMDSKTYPTRKRERNNDAH